MLTIPPVTPPHWWRFHSRIGRDHYIRVDTNDYSVHPLAIGHTVMVRADNPPSSPQPGPATALAPAHAARARPGDRPQARSRGRS
jgi:hypothetical protein